MKKLLTLAALLGAATLSYGQGQISFANTALTLISTNSAPGGLATGPTSSALGSFYFGLFYAPTTVTSVTGLGDPNWIFSGAYASNTASSSGGRLQGGQPVVNGIPAGGTVNVLVRGWSGNLGQDWNNVLAWYNNGTPSGSTPEWLGTSQIAQGVIFNASPSPINALFGAGGGALIPGFTLNMIAVPEPTSIALAGLGAAALFIFRRRK